MKALIAAAAVCAGLASPAMADWTPGSNHFEVIVRNLGNHPSFSAEWIYSLPRIADACGEKVVKAQLYNVVERFRFTEFFATQFENLKSGKMDNVVLDEWNKLDESGHEVGCRVADRLWGEDGHQFPGILIHR